MTDKPACADEEGDVDHEWEPFSDPAQPARNVHCKQCGALGTKVRARSIYDLLGGES